MYEINQILPFEIFSLELSDQILLLHFYYHEANAIQLKPYVNDIRIVLLKAIMNLMHFFQL